MAKRDGLFVDGAAGAPSYSGIELRAALQSMQPGVIGPGDFKVTAGAGLTLDSAAGEALIGGNAAIFRSGKYLVSDDSSENSVTWERSGGGTGIPANASTNPRLDAVVLVQNDTSVDGSGRRDWVRKYVPGVATAGAALGGALPAGMSIPSSGNMLMLAEVLVPANSPTTIPAANIRDRRAWAKGAFRAITRNNGTTYVTTNTLTHAAIDSTNLSPRLELSGNPLRLMMLGIGAVSVAGAPGAFNVLDNGVLVAGSDLGRIASITANIASGFLMTGIAQPAAGSHLIQPTFHAGGSAQSLTLQQNASYPLTFIVEEIIRPNADNT